MNVNVNSLEANADFALFPLYLPGSTQTVQPPGYADRGVPRSIYSAIQPLAIVVDPLMMLANSKNGALGGLHEAYDTVTVWVNGVATGASDYVKPGKESERMLLHLQPGWFNDGVNTMRYRVERLSGNYEDSLPLKVLYYNPPSDITVSHPASINQGQTGTVNIIITYPRPYSTVTLTIGTWSITFPNFDHTKPITYSLTAADLQQIGVGNHPVSAIIRDQLSNSNVSPTTSIAVVAAPPLSVNPSQLSLNGVMVRSLHLRAPNVVDAPGNTAVLQVTGGVGPYTFQSSAPQIASVNAQGKVEGMGNSSAVITIRDQNGSTVSVQVTVSNIYDLTIFHFVGMTYPLYLQSLAASKWISMTPQIQVALGCYNAPALNWLVQPNPLSNFAWTGPASGNSAQAYNGINGTFAYHNQTVNHPDQGLGFFLKP
ncbi:hypothetical protein [Pseudomonas paraglycinae]|jgi:hypothetical protein|uniref:hypothetical protein n=1 Tax=Pseudomonas paraglycinae TaxID=2892330 RepID=UPI003FD5D8A2